MVSRIFQRMSSQLQAPPTPPFDRLPATGPGPSDSDDTASSLSKTFDCHPQHSSPEPAFAFFPWVSHGLLQEDEPLRHHASDPGPSSCHRILPPYLVFLRKALVGAAHTSQLCGQGPARQLPGAEERPGWRPWSDPHGPFPLRGPATAAGFTGRSCLTTRPEPPKEGLLISQSGFWTTH